MGHDDNARTCSNCGALLAAGEAVCQHCGRRNSAFQFSPEIVLTLSGLLLAVLFFLTGFVTRAYHQKLGNLSQQWFQRGQKDLHAGKASQATGDFRTALVYSPDDTQIQFRLAEALAALGHYPEAHAYLLQLLGQEPSDAPINLALARLAAHAGSEADALRYYHGAIFGVWPEGPAARRLDTRFELCRFLLDRHDDSNAEAELIALAAEIPEQNAELHVQAGDLFVRAGDPTHGLEEFRRALAISPSLVPALRGAGLAAYQIGDYRRAQGYLERVHRADKKDSEVSSALDLSRLVLLADPSTPGLSETERRERVRGDFRQAFSRLQGCMKTLGISTSSATPQHSDIAGLWAKAKDMQPRLSRISFRRSENQDAALSLAFEIERLCAQKCGPPPDADEALLLLEKNRGGGQR